MAVMHRASLSSASRVITAPPHCTHDLAWHGLSLSLSLSRYITYHSYAPEKPQYPPAKLFAVLRNVKLSAQTIWRILRNQQVAMQ